MKIDLGRVVFAALGLSLLVAGCDSGSHPEPRGNPDLAGFKGTTEGPGTVADAAMMPADMANPAMAACSAPVAIMDGTTLTNQDSGTSATTLTSACIDYANGSVLFYSATIPANSRLSVQVTPTDGVFDPVLRLIDDCAATSCGATADSGFEGDAETLSFSNSTATPRKVLIAVGGYQDAGTFDLTAHIATLAVNAACTGAKPVMNGSSLVGEDANGGGDTIDACLSYSTGGVLYYSISLAARTELTVTATPTGTSSWDPSLRLLDTCGALDCVDSSDVGYSNEAETLSFRNKTSTAKPLLIAVGAGAPGVAGTFNLTVATVALPPPPANALCSGAIALVDGTTRLAEDASEAIDSLSSACLPGASGPVLYYKATLPANSQLDVHVSPTGTNSWDPTLRLVDACGATSCLASADEGYSGGDETLTYKNTGATAMPVIVAVGSYGSSNGTFDLDAHIKPLSMPATNLSCAMPTAMSDGQTKADQDLALATETESNLCVSGGVGPVVYYSTSIPAGKRLIARAVPKSAWDPVMRLLSSCTATTCLGSADAGASSASEALSYKNTGATAKPVIFTVGSYSASTFGTFDLSMAIKSMPTNTTCANALAVTSGTTLSVESGDDAVNGQTACLSTAVGKVLFYKISIPAGKTLQVDATPLGNWDPVIRLVTTCSATTCLGSADLGAGGASESLSYTNTGATAKAVVISVGGYYATTSAFELSVSTL